MVNWGKASLFFGGIAWILLGSYILIIREKIFRFFSRNASEELRKDRFMRFGGWYALLGPVIGLIGLGIAMILVSLGIIIPKP
ncbi:hypothetical protein KY366_08320 [Candidatus Woesearchaeota archaeon]|nr:hypothetical protein [Candidatus Woesearchaeota archaeon]